MPEGGNGHLLHTTISLAVLAGAVAMLAYGVLTSDAALWGWGLVVLAGGLYTAKGHLS